MKTEFKKYIYNKYWFRRIRGYNWFSFRYWWFNYLLWSILIALLLWLINSRNADTSSCSFNSSEKIERIKEDLSKCCECSRRDSIPPVDSNEIFLPADYIVITYQFDASGGKDLDTRTQIITPNSGNILGYCKKTDDANIHWSGDNIGLGVESVYIDLKAFEPDETITVLCKAFWFSKRKSGDMSLDIRAYKGGKMIKKPGDKYQFINEGGEQVGEIISFPKNITIRKGACIGGEKIGNVIYKKSNQTLSFEE